MRIKKFNRPKKIFSLPEINNNKFIFEKLSQYCIKLTFEHKNGVPRNIPDEVKIICQESNKSAWNDRLFKTIDRDDGKGNKTKKDVGRDFFLLFDKNYEIKFRGKKTKTVTIMKIEFNNGEFLIHHLKKVIDDDDSDIGDFGENENDDGEDIGDDNDEEYIDKMEF